MNSSANDLNGKFIFAYLPYKATSDKPGGKPNHFWVYLFNLVSTDSTVPVAILYICSDHNNIGIDICCRCQTLNFPSDGRRSNLWWPSCNVLDVSFAWLISFKDSSNVSNFLPVFQTVGILWPHTLKGSPHGVMVKAMDCGIVVSEFVLQSCYYVHIRANTLGKGMNPLISLQLWVNSRTD